MTKTLPGPYVVRHRYQRAMAQAIAAGLAALRRAVRSGALARLCEKHGLSLLVLLGSSVADFDQDARDSAIPPRDIDLALLPGGDLETRLAHVEEQVAALTPSQA